MTYIYAEALLTPSPYLSWNLPDFWCRLSSNNRSRFCFSKSAAKLL